MKKLNEKNLLVGAVAFVAVLGFINIIGLVAAKGDMLAQVFGTSLSKPVSHGSVHYGIGENNYGQQVGLTFKDNKILTITACGGGGGGGGGGFGWEDGDDEGSGGGGGGGGGKGACLTRILKLRSGDTIRWLVGGGGHGGLGGVREINEDFSVSDVLINPTYGADGGTTYVSINGIDVIQAEGGRGGAYGSNAWGDGVGGGGGWGGSLTNAQASWHKGATGVGQWDFWPEIDAGNGGRGGRGENNSSVGDLMTDGAEGLAYGNNPHGGNGGNGGISFGGGGGGGGGGHWQDWDSNGDNYINTHFNSGGFGGNGGPGGVDISW